VAKDPATRYPSARALAEALSDAAHLAGMQASHEDVGAYVARVVGSDLAARRESIASAERGLSGPRRKRLALVAFATGALVLTGLALALGRAERVLDAAAPAVASPSPIPVAAPASSPPDPEPRSSAPPPAPSAAASVQPSSPAPPPRPRGASSAPPPRLPPPNPYVHHGGTR
jgi:hypothetical protein